ncbi:MAG: ABC transporter permease [Thiohalomonadaceae bacterium]
MEGAPVHTARSAATVTLAVWKALFLREALYRLFSGRTAWLWLLLEPVVHIAFLIFIFALVRMRVVGGIDTPLWLMVGLLAFFMFRRTGTQAMNAVSSNQALFAYRQVKPADAVLARAGLEGFLMIIVATVLFGAGALCGLSVVPADPLAVLEAFFGLWLVGLGFGLIGSVASELVKELGKVIGLLMTPLYFMSGVIFPIDIVPPPYREWLLYNPLVHGLEAARLGFAPFYHAVPELSVAYLYGFALVTVSFGLALQVRYATRLATQ